MEELLVEKDKKTILIVDDEKSIRELLAFNLEKEGYKGIAEESGLNVAMEE